jgi:UDP-2,4-diacetamido-2,4,6-trideoxy-beta-L-altropyranose hydrolase
VNILIRVDSSRLIGSGHIMRCLVLANLFTKDGHHVSFLCRDLPGHCADFLKAQNYDYYLLPFAVEEKDKYSRLQATDDYSVWLGVNQDIDAQETVNYIKRNPVDLLIVDVYGLDHRWQVQIKNYIRKLMVVDDLANRNHVCDVLLDHNYYHNLSSRYDHLVPVECIKFLGPQYALLNSELRKTKEQRLQMRKHDNQAVDNVLVFLGGVDIKNYTDVVLQHLLQSKYAAANIEVVLGKSNPFKESLVTSFQHYKNIRFHIQPSYYYQLMEAADLSINAGGVSALERLYVGLPSILVCTAENQRQICMDFKKLKIAEYNEDLGYLSRVLDSFNPQAFNFSYPELNHSIITQTLSST